MKSALRNPEDWILRYIRTNFFKNLPIRKRQCQTLVTRTPLASRCVQKSLNSNLPILNIVDCRIVVTSACLYLCYIIVNNVLNKISSSSSL